MAMTEGSGRRRWIAGAVVVVLAALAVFAVTQLGEDDDPVDAGRAGEEAASESAGEDDEDGSSDDAVDAGDAGTDATDSDATDSGATSAPDVDSPNDPNAPPVDPGEGPNTPVARDPGAPVGSPANPTPVGTAFDMGGWRITVVAPGGDGGSVTARVRLEWRGREGVGAGDPKELVLRITDAGGVDRVLGGDACPAGAADALQGISSLAEGASTEVDLCWTVPAGDRAAMALIAESSQLAETAYYAVA